MMKTMLNRRLKTTTALLLMMIMMMMLLLVVVVVTALVTTIRLKDSFTNALRYTQALKHRRTLHTLSKARL